MKPLLTLLLLALSLTLSAVPSKRDTFVHTQSDGTVLTLCQVGDEYLHYFVNVITGEAMVCGADGDFVVLPLLQLQQLQEQAAVARAAANSERVQRLPRMRPSSRLKRAYGEYKPMVGTKRGLVILVEFQDVKFVTPDARDAFDRQFNEPGYSDNHHVGSLADYFREQSYGKFSLEFDVVGPVTLSHDLAYYGGNNSAGNDSHPALIARDGVRLADSQCGVDFSLYDWDGDGTVEQVYLIYAGYNEAQSHRANDVWAHQWNLKDAGYYETIDGVKIRPYACSSELCGATGTTLDGIGTPCHEFSHCLGYPDLYDVDYDTNGRGTGMGCYDIMAEGNYNGPDACSQVPCGYSAYERWMAGWLTPVELSEPATVSHMKSIDDSSGEAYIIYNDNNRDEYFILECRRADRWFSYYRGSAAGHGLLITHCDYDRAAWTSNKVNVDAQHQRFVYVAADGNYYSWTVAGDLFPGTAGVTAFLDDSHANAGGSLADGMPLGKPVTNICEDEATGTVAFDFMGGDNDSDGRYTVTLDACGGTVTPTTWQQQRYGESLTLPEPVPDDAQWTAAGWSLTPVTTATPYDELTLLDYGAPYRPTADVTLYAVYLNDEFLCHSYPVTDAVATVAAPAAPDKVFTVAGTPVTTPTTHGLYVVNGRVLRF